MGGEYAEIPMVYWMREAELKHGRICMLAVVGWLTVDAGIHFPGEKYTGIDALHAHDAMLASGDIGLDPLEFCGNPDTKKFMLEAETTHARLAMLGFSGLCTQSALLESHTFPYLS